MTAGHAQPLAWARSADLDVRVMCAVEGTRHHRPGQARYLADVSQKVSEIDNSRLLGDGVPGKGDPIDRRPHHRGTAGPPSRRALRLIPVALAVLAAYLAAQSTWVITAGFRARHSPAGIAWTALTAAVMFALARGKHRTGTALGNPVLITEGRVTLIDGALAAAVLAGLILSTALGWWWADPAAGYVLVFYTAREARAILAGQH
jgi:hypothetical protein